MSISFLQMGIVFIGAYLLSSIPFGFVITRMMGLGDLRKIGSGNIGTTNVFRTGNKIAATLTLILDIGKGGIAVIITAVATNEPVLVAIAATAGVIGHCYPIWLGFKGGKGAATGVGVILAINPFSGLGMIAIWLVTAGVFRISSLASIIMYLAAPALVYFFADTVVQQPYTISAGLIASISIWRHRSNINRLMKGEESKIDT